MTPFVKCIQDRKNIVNYDIVYSKIAHKYSYKILYK